MSFSQYSKEPLSQGLFYLSQQSLLIPLSSIPSDPCTFRHCPSVPRMLDLYSQAPIARLLRASLTLTLFQSLCLWGFTKIISSKTKSRVLFPARGPLRCHLSRLLRVLVPAPLVLNCVVCAGEEVNGRWRQSRSQRPDPDPDAHRQSSTEHQAGLS